MHMVGHNLKDAMHRATLDHPETYSFVDVSQNNHRTGQTHWDGLAYVRKYLAARPRPMNSVKVYGADTAGYGTDRDGQERFWRNIFAGLASSRFHRPPAGLGLTGKAQASLKSARMLMNELDFTRCRPDNSLLGQRSPNEAYCFAEAGKAYAVYFPGSDSGKAADVTLDLSAAKSAGKVRWLDIAASRWADAPAAPAGAKLSLKPPSGAMWVALVKMGR